MKHSFIILAIAPGRREIGTATFRGLELFHFGLKSIKNGSTDKPLKDERCRLVRELFIEHKPTVVVIRTPSRYQISSTRIIPVLQAIERQAGLDHVPVVGISLEEVKDALCGGGKPTQKNAFRNLAEIYPALRQFLDRPSSWQNRYYNRLLSAASAGTTYLKSLLSCG